MMARSATDPALQFVKPSAVERGMIPAAPALFGTAEMRDALAIEAERQVARALTMLARARRLVEADRADTLPLLTARRRYLAAHLQRYQRFKHGRIFDPVIRDGTASSRIVARTMKVDCVALGERFGAHHARWTDASAADWRNYRADTMALIDLLSIHLKEELRAMRQLLQIADFYAA